MIDFGDLRTLREYLHMTQQEMAQAMGITLRYYKYIESGDRPLTAKPAQALYQHLRAYHSDLVTITQVIDCLSRIEI